MEICGRLLTDKERDAIKSNIVFIAGNFTQEELEEIFTLLENQDTNEVNK